MNTLTHWNPFREMQDLQNRVLHALQNKAAAAGNGQQKSITVAEWAPAVDITEDATEYLIKAELPEIKREDVKVTVENGMLILSGERRLDKEENGRKFHRVERAYGSFLRSFHVPEDTDTEKVSAEFKDGVLLIHLPKQEAAKPRQIEVKID
jgi:HSP20 family protein